MNDESTTTKPGQNNESFIEVTLTEPEFWAIVKIAEEQGANFCRADLPEPVRELTIDQILAIPGLAAFVKWEAEDVPEEWKAGRAGDEGGAPGKYESAIRGERGFSFTAAHSNRLQYLVSNEAGDWWVRASTELLRLTINVVCDDRYPNLSLRPWDLPPKRVQQYYNPRHVEVIIPQRHRSLSRYGLAAKQLHGEGGTGLPLERQQYYIDKLGELDDLSMCGWLISGPGATSKTTLQAVWLKDAITRRSCCFGVLLAMDEADGIPQTEGFSLCIWSINAGAWLDSVEEWYETPVPERDQDNRPLLPEAIKQAVAVGGWRPILWIEELQNMHLTERRLKWFHNLLDAVYCEEGLIMANTNWTKEELRKHLPDATRRRVTGEGEGDRKHLFQCWDFHAAAEAEPKGKRKKAA